MKKILLIFPLIFNFSSTIAAESNSTYLFISVSGRPSVLPMVNINQCETMRLLFEGKIGNLSNKNGDTFALCLSGK